jgi:riboflavin synthase
MDKMGVGDIVNLERAATAETALGGHMVQGHIDGVGTVASFVASGEDRLLTIALSPELHDDVVDRGSIAIDGVSLTIAQRHQEPCVTIAIIPYTFDNTVIGRYRDGDTVNVETDVIGKYVKQYVERLTDGGGVRKTG